MTAFVGIRNHGTKGKPNAMYWLPRIALLTGMRLNEICSLEASDMKTAEGIRVFAADTVKLEKYIAEKL